LVTSGLLPALAIVTAVALIFAGVVGGYAWALHQASQQVRPEFNVESALARIETERARNQLDAIKLVDEIADYAAVVKRHRHRIDGAEGGKRAQANREAAAIALLPPEPDDPAVAQAAALEARRAAIRARFAGR